MSEQAKRGRPPLLTRDEMRERALVVLLRDGYDAVTMADIAVELGVSVRTLHRHFPAKADLIWDGLDQAFDQLHAHLEHAPLDEPVLVSIERAALASIHPGLRTDPAHRGRLRLIATTPALQEQQPERLRAWADDIAAFAAGRLGSSADDVAPLAIAAAVLGATSAALKRWALSAEDTPPDAALQGAFRALLLAAS